MRASRLQGTRRHEARGRSAPRGLHLCVCPRSARRRWRGGAATSAAAAAASAAAAVPAASGTGTRAGAGAVGSRWAGAGDTCPLGPDGRWNRTRVRSASPRALLAGGPGPGLKGGAECVRGSSGVPGSPCPTPAGQRRPSEHPRCRA